MSILDDIIGAIPAVSGLLGSVGSIFDLTGAGGKDSSQQLSQQQLQGEQFLQQQALKMAQAGQTNARGDVLSYNPKTNTWTTKPSAETQALIKSSDAEQLAQLQHDAPLARVEQARERAARGGAGQAANAALTQFQDYNPMTADRLSSDLYTQAARGLKEGYGQTASDVSTQALRAGTGGGQLLDQLARSYARDLASARVNSRLSGLTQSNDINTARTNTLLDQYSKLRGVAAGVPNVSTSPDTLNANLASLLNSQRGGASGQVANAAGITSTGYQNLIGQNTNYYQDLGMAGNDLATGLGSILNQFNTPSSNLTAFNSSGSIGNTSTGVPQAQRAGF